MRTTTSRDSWQGTAATGMTKGDLRYASYATEATIAAQCALPRLFAQSARTLLQHAGQESVHFTRKAHWNLIGLRYLWRPFSLDDALLVCQGFRATGSIMQASVMTPSSSYRRCAQPCVGKTPGCLALPRRRTLHVVQASASPPTSGAGVLQRLGRLLKEKATGDFERFFKGASKTRERLGLVEELLTFWTLEDYESSLEELEEALIAADFGPKTAIRIADKIRKGIKSGKVKTSDDMRASLKAAIVELLTPRSGKSPDLQLQGKPSVVLIVGVNGAGKTTTIGKLATKLGREGAKVHLVPGDTFRAAAAEQLGEWARRSGASIGPFQEGRPPHTVIADCCQAVQASNPPADVILCDTAGRLHTAYALMEELQECKQAIAKAVPGQPDEVLLVLDGTTGLNMLNQAREFNGMVQLTGLILTKLDGSARGGAVVSVVDTLGLPVKFIGVGETVDDLQTFEAQSFAEALFPSASSKS